MARIVKHYSNREEWEAERKKGIGASDVPAIMCVSPFQTAQDVYMMKKGLKENDPNNVYFKRGHLLEGSVADWFALETGAEIMANSVEDFHVWQENEDWLRVSPDRFYYEAGAYHNNTNQRVLEIKTTALRVDPNDIPLHWYVQLQTIMGVCDISKGALAWLDGGLNFGCVYYDFSPSIFDKVKSRCRSFWFENVMANVMPPVVNANDVKERYAVATKDKAVEASTVDLERIDELKRLKNEQKILESNITDLEDKIKCAMLDSDTLTASDGTVLATWKNSKPSMTFDKTLFKKENEELYKKYEVVGKPRRTFLLK
jgi:putative phage-type endonuclease